MSRLVPIMSLVCCALLIQACTAPIKKVYVSPAESNSSRLIDLNKYAYVRAHRGYQQIRPVGGAEFSRLSRGVFEEFLPGRYEINVRADYALRETNVVRQRIGSGELLKRDLEPAELTVEVELQAGQLLDGFILGWDKPIRGMLMTEAYVLRIADPARYVVTEDGRRFQDLKGTPEYDAAEKPPIQNIGAWDICKSCPWSK